MRPSSVSYMLNPKDLVQPQQQKQQLRHQRSNRREPSVDNTMARPADIRHKGLLLQHDARHPPDSVTPVQQQLQQQRLTLSGQYSWIPVL